MQTVKTSRFFDAFASAINWNALLYSLYKLCFVTLTFVLYRLLPAGYFSQWATVNSLIYLLLLWLNCGFKKSIPRFAPEVSKNYTFHRKCIAYLFLIKVLILTVGIPLLGLALHKFVPSLFSLPLVMGLFVTEGLCSLVMLLYHAHFWQKQFNILEALFLLLEMSTNGIFLYWGSHDPIAIITFLFISKLYSNAGLLVTSLFLLPRLYSRAPITGNEKLNERALVIAFAKHSFFMWLTVIFQSLSERNFLFPFITAVQGTVIANSFKVVHDASISFQRIAIQTIGVADTALLSYIEVTDHRLSQMRLAFTSIFKTVVLLCLPLLCLGILFFLKNYASLSSESIILFIIVAGGSALEIIVSPYARMLEVKMNYREIFYSYVPYIFGFALLLALYVQQIITLLTFIGYLHFFRLVGALSMVYYAKKKFAIVLPVTFSGTVVGLCSLATLIAWYLLHYK